MFADNLRRLRIARGYPRARQLARELGIKENRYTRYERGQAEPPLELIYAICAKLAVTPNDLFGVEVEGKSTTRPIIDIGGFANGEDPPLASPAASDPDIASWRLAKIMLDAAPAAHDLGRLRHEDDPLADVRAVAMLAAKLREDPTGVLQRFVSNPELIRLPRTVRADIRSEIDRYLDRLLAA